LTCVIVAPGPAYATGLDRKGISTRISVSELNNIEDVTSEFVKQFGINYTSKVFVSAIDVPEGGSYQPNGIISISAKVLKKQLKENLDIIVKNVRKVPVVGNTIGDWLEKNAGPLISFLDKVEGGAYEALVRFFVGRGMEQSTAEIWADIIVTVVGWLI